MRDSGSNCHHGVVYFVSLTYCICCSLGTLHLLAGYGRAHGHYVLRNASSTAPEVVMFRGPSQLTRESIKTDRSALNWRRLKEQLAIFHHVMARRLYEKSGLEQGN
jgi:hypothetical protein